VPWDVCLALFFSEETYSPSASMTPRGKLFLISEGALAYVKRCRQESDRARRRVAMAYALNRAAPEKSGRNLRMSSDRT
jgi:hypothetical protein